MNKPLLTLTLAAMAFRAAAAPIELSAGNLVYAMTFDVLASATNNNAANSTWTDDGTIPGWWWYRAGNTAGAPTGLAGASAAYYVSDGTAAPQTAPLAHGFYSLGGLNAPDRAMGLCPTTALGEISALAIFHNSTAFPIKLSHVKFTTKAYRANGTASNKDSIFVWYKSAASVAALTTNTIAAANSNTTDFLTGVNTTAPTSQYITTWTNLPEFTRVTSNGTASLVFSPVETFTFDAAPSSSSVLVPAREYLAIRWSNINDGGTDAVQGFDDLTLTFALTNTCVVSAAASGAVRLPGADAGLPDDDSVSFSLNASATGGSPSGWLVPAGGPGAGTASAYDTPVSVTLPISAFSAAGTATIRVEDASGPGCFTTVTVSAPPFIQHVTATHSPLITFTPSANGDAAFAPPGNDQSELGWSGGSPGAATLSNVQTQPANAPYTGTNKYWHLTTANSTFTTNPVDVSDIAGQTLKGHIELSFYSTSATTLDAGDVLNAKLEVALDGNFANTAAGNILTSVFVDLPTGSTAAEATDLSAALACAATYINLTAATYPTADFNFHPYEKTLAIPAGASAARAHIVYSSGAGISNTEHVLLDNVKFSLLTVAPDTDGDNIPDDYEDAHGLDKTSNADRDTDLDGDGQSNYLEYLAGTAANSSADYLHITNAAISPAGEISLTWASVAGKKYQARISTDLGVTNQWATLGGPVTATGASSSIPPGNIIPAGLYPRYFLRIELVP